MPPRRRVATPARAAPARIDLSPRQHAAIQSGADITVFGGGNGGGKTFTLLMLPLQPEYFTTAGVSAVLFAESVPKLTQEKGLVDKAKEWYAPFHPDGEGGYHQTLRRWTFARGGGEVHIKLSFVGEPGQWDGMEAAIICIDQVEQVSEKQFFSVCSRNRTMTAARPRVFVTANPPEEGRDHWLTKLLTAGGWIGADGYPVPERDGKVRHFARVGEDFIFADSAAELSEAGHLERDRDGREIPPKSITFLQALVDDHPDERFREAYKRELAALPEVERLRRLRGNWYVIEEAGKYFQATMFPKVDYEPSRHARKVRTWDNAWSANDQADLTVGLLESFEPDGSINMCDLICFRGKPAHVERAIEMVAELDGKDVTIRLPADAGAAGALQAGWAQRLGAKGYTVVLTKDKGDKLQRSKPYQACCERRQVRLVNSHTSARIAERLTQDFEIFNKDGDREVVHGLDCSKVLTLTGWHPVFLEHHVQFGKSTVAKRHIKKDTVDAAVGGYEHVTTDEEPRPLTPQEAQNAQETLRRLQKGMSALLRPSRSVPF